MKFNQALLLATLVLGIAPAAYGQSSPPATSTTTPPTLLDRSRWAPSLPISDLANGRESCTLMRFTVLADGTTANVQPIDRLGKADYTVAAKAIIARWRFTPGTQNGQAIDTENLQHLLCFGLGAEKRGAAGANYRRLREVNQLLDQRKLEEAEALVITLEDEANTLYEIMHTRIRRAIIANLRGNPELALRLLWQLSCLDNVIERPEYTRMLRLQLGLELRLGRLANAELTLPHFISFGSAPEDAPLVAGLEKLRAAAQSPAPMVIPGRIVDDCGQIGCVDGDAGWDYVPVRRTISLADIKGTLTELSGRCERKTFSAKPEEGVTWTIPASWGKCDIVIKGAPDTTFKLIDENPAA